MHVYVCIHVCIHICVYVCMYTFHMKHKYHNMNYDIKNVATNDKDFIYKIYNTFL